MSDEEKGEYVRKLYQGRPLEGNEAIAQLVTTKPDTEVADEFKKRLVETYTPMLALFDDIKAAGFECGCAAGMGPLGKHVITMMRIFKEF